VNIRSAAILLAIGIIFLIANKSAYQGYFQDDELTNIVMTRAIPAEVWVQGFVTPKLARDNFRPAGHIYFVVLNRLAHLDFPKYVYPVHLLHLLNGVLLWLFLRRIGIGTLGCAAGVTFFVLSVAAFDAYWKPMYIFDVLCTTFCLAALLLYTSGHWLVALPAMWLAYKSKELAIMLPLVLAFFEFTIGQRRWKRLIPFFLISLIFGVQAMLNNNVRHTDYSFVFTPAAVGSTLKFYSSRLFVLPFAGLLFLTLPFIFREKRMFLGLAMLAAFFLPLLFLPGRMFAAYCYLPLTGAAVEIATLATIAPPAWTLAFFALWMPWNFYQHRRDSKLTLAMDRDNRTYVNGLFDYSRAHPKLPQLAFAQFPENFHVWGMQAALNYPIANTNIDIAYMDELHARALPADANITFLNWDRQRKELFVIPKDPSAPELSYLYMDARTPVWQLEDGWYTLDDYFRWIEPHATVRLTRPPEADVFEVVANVSPALIQKYGYSHLRVSLDGTVLGSKRFESAGIHKVRWSLPGGKPGPVRVAFDVEPKAVYPPDPRLLGIALVSFGMVIPASNGH
jgi:hypothetical protein